MAYEPDVRLLRYFLAVAQDLHFGRAAQRLFVSQPALSQQIRRLENELGVVLFDRDRRGVRLTGGGQALLGPARAVVDAMGRFTVEARSYRSAADGDLVLGFQVQLPGNALAHIVREHRIRHPDVRVDLRQYDFSDTSAGLVDGTTDVAVVSLPVVHDLRTWPLYRERVVALLPSGTALAGSASVTVADLVATGLPWARPPDNDQVWRDYWTAAEQRARLDPPAVVRFDVPPNIESYVLRVASGQLLGLTNEGFVSSYPLGGVVAVPVVDVPPVRFAVAHRPGDNRAAVTDLVATVRRILAT
jgi:DNA-binding transcriptional LysR family regulator